MHPNRNEDYAGLKFEPRNCRSLHLNRNDEPHGMTATSGSGGCSKQRKIQQVIVARLDFHGYCARGCFCFLIFVVSIVCQVGYPKKLPIARPWRLLVPVCCSAGKPGGLQNHPEE